MVAEAQSNGFGYSETNIAAQRFDVRYVTPEVSLPVNEARRLSALADQKQRAYDLALWRAAQIALERGYGAMTVEQDHRDADVTVRRQSVPVAAGAYGPYGPGGGLYPGWPYDSPYYYTRPGFATPFWFYNDPFAYETRLSVSGRIKASLLVTFAKLPGPGSLDAAATAQRLAKQYAGATY